MPGITVFRPSGKFFGFEDLDIKGFETKSRQDEYQNDLDKPDSAGDFH
jgi:hypothetical protein